VTGAGAHLGPEFGQVLQEQIGQALEPAMAEFREQMAATVRRELDETLQQDHPRPRDMGQRSTDRRRDEEQPVADREGSQSADGGQSKAPESKAPESTRQGGSQTLLTLLGKPLLEALPQILEQQGEQWLQSRLDDGFDVVFSGWVRAAAQQDVERILQVVPRVAIELVPDRATREDLRSEAKQTVETLVANAFDRLFSDEVRDDLKARGHQAIHDLFHPNLKSVIHQLQELLLSLLEGLLAVLRECWEQVLQLLLKVVIALVQSRLASGLKDVISSLAMTPGRSTEKRGALPHSENEEDESEMRETRSESSDDVSHSDSKDPEQRTRAGNEPASRRGDDDEKRSGRVPSPRPSSERSSSAKQPSGRQSSDRTVSSRSSRTASR